MKLTLEALKPGLNQFDMKNKKGVTGDFFDTVITIILVVVFAGFLFVFIGMQKNGAGFWEDVYAKEIAQIVNMAKPGDEISVDIHYASKIAQKNRVADLASIVKFDNEKKEVVIKLRPYGETRFSYIKEIEISDAKIEFGAPTNVLKFKVVKTGKEVKNE